MRGLLALSRAIDACTTFIGKSASWMILVAVLVSAINAIVRKVFNYSSNGWLELQWYLYGIAYMGAAAWTLNLNEHIRIDLLYTRASRWVQHWIDLLGHLLFLIPFAWLLVYYLYPWFLSAYRTGETSPNASGLILWPARLILLLGFVLLLIQGISEIIKKIAVITGAIPDPNPHVPQHEATLAEAEELAREMRDNLPPEQAASAQESRK